MKLKNIKPTLVLSAICLVVALILAGVNQITSPIIEEAKIAAENEALAEVLPGAKNFKPLTLNDSYPSVVKKGYSADGGYVFTMQVVGYKDGLEIICGVTADGKIAGVKDLQSNETYGYEDELNNVYIGDSRDNLELIIATGASKNSKTSKAYYDAIKAALDAAIVAGGGEVDLRTPEQILSDNCNAALGTEGLAFKKWFATEVITGIDTVYESEGGRVFAIGETLIGVKTDGTVSAAAEIPEESINAAKAADAVIKESNLTKITELPAGLHKNFVEASVTASGNYVITAKGAGYGINGDWGNSGEYMIVKVSITPDGKIIDTATVYHSESADVGGLVLSDPDFVDKFDGKTKDDYTTVENVANATLTCDGYKNAITVAFGSYELLKGGNQ